MVRPRVRIRFCKQGDLRLIGHRDLMRCLERLFRRAGLALAMSQGFHPKPRVTFPLALAVGIEGLDEVMELELTESPLPTSFAIVVASSAAGAGVPLGGNPGVRQPQGSAAQRRLSGVDSHAAPSGVGGADRPFMGRFLLALAAPAARRDDRSSRRFGIALLASGDVADAVRAGPEGRAGPRDVLAALELAERRAARRSSDPHRRGDRRMSDPQRSRPRLAPCRPPMRACRSCRTRKREHEKRDSDQRFPTGGMPDCDR